MRKPTKPTVKPKRSRLRLAVFVVSSALNVLAVVGVTVAICEPVPLYQDEGEQ